MNINTNMQNNTIFGCNIHLEIYAKKCGSKSLSLLMADSYQILSKNCNFLAKLKIVPFK